MKELWFCLFFFLNTIIPFLYHLPIYFLSSFFIFFILLSVFFPFCDLMAVSSSSANSLITCPLLVCHSLLVFCPYAVKEGSERLPLLPHLLCWLLSGLVFLVSKGVDGVFLVADAVILFLK